MGEEKTTKERVSVLESKFESMMEVLINNNENITNELAEMKKPLTELSEKQKEMLPIIQEIILVKGYGGLFWRITKQIGIWTLGIMASWAMFKDHIKHFIHYIFN